VSTFGKGGAKIGRQNIILFIIIYFIYFIYFIYYYANEKRRLFRLLKWRLFKILCERNTGHYFGSTFLYFVIKGGLCERNTAHYFGY